MILDSGARREFETSAVRDITENKGRCDLLPLDVVGLLLKRHGKDKQSTMLCKINDYVRYGEVCALFDAVLEFAEEENIDVYSMLVEVAKHYEEGAQKYDERNWEKGIPTHCYIDSGVRHLFKHWRGDEDESHNRAFVWNMLGCVWTHFNHSNLNDLPHAIKLSEEK
jgi:hypothetical protein